MVDICNGKLRLNTVNSHRLKLKVCHCTRGILSQSLVDFKTDFTANRHIAGKQMIFDNFLSYCVSHSVETSDLFKILTIFILLYNALFVNVLTVFSDKNLRQYHIKYTAHLAQIRFLHVILKLLAYARIKSL